jgi:hypothetical protein
MYESGLIGSDIMRVDNHMKIVSGTSGKSQIKQKRETVGMRKHKKKTQNTEEMRREEEQRR